MAESKNPFESDKPVYFLMGDTGVKVSNDPRHHDAEYKEKVLAEMENTGAITRHDRVVAEELGTGAPVGTMTGAQAQQPAMPVRVVQDTDDARDELLDKDVDDMTVEELKAHASELESQGVEIDRSDVKTKKQLAAAIKKAVREEQKG